MLCAMLQGIKLYWHVLEAMLKAEEARAGLPAAGKCSSPPYTLVLLRVDSCATLSHGSFGICNALHLRSAPQGSVGMQLAAA